MVCKTKCRIVFPCGLRFESDIRVGGFFVRGSIFFDEYKLLDKIKEIGCPIHGKKCLPIKKR